jgi:flagellar assembly protein FliH
MESFDMSDSSSAPDTRPSTFEPSYAGSSDDKTLRFMPLFDDREKAIGIIDEAKKKASLIESEAYEKGFAQGEKDGFEMGTKKVDKILDRIHGTLQDMVAYRQEFIKRYEKETLHLICAIAEKVVRGAVKVDNQIVREAILEAFSLAVDRSEVTVRVNPDEVEYVKEIRPEFFDRISELKSITIESDPSITPGGCFMETAFGSVDARLETQLEKITKAVERAFGIDD